MLGEVREELLSAVLTALGSGSAFCVYQEVCQRKESGATAPSTNLLLFSQRGCRQGGTKMAGAQCLGVPEGTLGKSGSAKRSCHPQG